MLHTGTTSLVGPFPTMVLVARPAASDAQRVGRGTVDNDWHALSEAVHQSHRNPSVVVLMMMVMPTPAGFNDTAGQQAARDQQREHGRQFRSHDASPALIPIPTIIFPPMMADPFSVSPYLPAMFLAPWSAAIPINALDPRLLHDGCPSAGSNRQAAENCEPKYNVAHVHTSAKRWQAVKANAWLGGVRIKCCPTRGLPQHCFERKFVLYDQRILLTVMASGSVTLGNIVDWTDVPAVICAQCDQAGQHHRKRTGAAIRRNSKRVTLIVHQGLSLI